HQIVGMRADRFAHGVDLIERALHGRRTGDIARHPDREEQRVRASLAHARDVDVAVRVPLPMSKAVSKISRCVVSSCESTTIARSCSCFARGETESGGACIKTATGIARAIAQKTFLIAVFFLVLTLATQTVRVSSYFDHGGTTAL